MATFQDGSSTEHPHIFGRGTRLSSEYTKGRKGLPMSLWLAKDSAGAKAWKQGRAEWRKAQKESR